jgi:hypothetical protein
MRRKNNFTTGPFIIIGKYGHFIRICMVIITLHIIACMPIIKIVYGIHKPKYESDSAVLKYSRGIGLQGEIYRLKDYSVRLITESSLTHLTDHNIFMSSRSQMKKA